MISFTVVTCTYNAEGELQRTVDSVLEQTFPFIEHLILDGASKDGTLQIANEYKQLSDESDNGHVVKVVSEPDNGLYDAMNKGIRMATNEYLIFLNAGDGFPSPETLDDVNASFADGEAHPGVLYGYADIVNNDGLFLRHRRLQSPSRLSWRSFKQGMLVCHQSFYARTDLARLCPYDLQYRYSADVDWCIRIMKEGEHKHLPLKNVGIVLVNYLEGGMSIQNHRASLYERFRVMRHHYGLFTTLIMHLWFIIRGVIKR